MKASSQASIWGVKIAKVYQSVFDSHDKPNKSVTFFQAWLDALEEHSAYSTHYCSQEQGSEEEDEEVMSLGELTDSLQVPVNKTIHN